MKMNKFPRFVALLLLLVLSFSLQAQKQMPVVVRGHADFAVGEEIRLVVYPDLLTYMPAVAAAVKVAKDGSFELKYNTREINLAQLEIRTSKAEFFIEPGHTYDLTVNMDPEYFNLLNPQDADAYLQVENNNPNTNDLNTRINYYTSYFNYVFNHYSFRIIYDHDRLACDSLLQIMNKKFSVRYAPLDFYKSYVYYDIAQLDAMYWHNDPDSIYEKYLNNDYILYNNPAYMDFFGSFYKDYPFTSQQINLDRLMECINDTVNYLGLFNEFGKDKFLVNERIRELVIIKSLAQMYLNYSEFDKENVVLMLKDIKDNTHFPEHKLLAENTLKDILLFSDDQLVKDVKLKEANGKDFSLKKLKGQWVYVHFFKTDCIECIREMMIIKELNDKYKDSVVFVGVSLDFDKYKWLNFLNTYSQLDWHFVHFNNQFQWMEALELNSLPDYMLISPEGNIRERYMPGPSTGLAEYFMRLFHHSETDDDNPMFNKGK